ncbi:Uncharacterised protein g2815 [Pycnogonum litorale]
MTALLMLVFLVRAASVVSAATKCPMEVKACRCAVIEKMDFEIRCERIGADVASAALINATNGASDYRLRNLVLDRVDLSGSFQFTSRVNSDLGNVALLNTNIPYTKIPETVGKMVRLEELRIDDNPGIFRLTIAFLDGFPKKIVRLSLNNDGIESIDDDAFVPLKETLAVLHLEHNGLTDVSITTFRHLEKLRQLFLRGNNVLQIVDKDVDVLKRSLPSLNTLALNRINCACETWNGQLRQWTIVKEIQYTDCGTPERLRDRSLKNIGENEFCPSAAPSESSSSRHTQSILPATTLFICYLSIVNK